MNNIGNDWDWFFNQVKNDSWFRQIEELVAAERQKYDVYPQEQDVFNAFKYTPYCDTKVVIIGQDPYIKPKQAHGLSFSVNPGMKIPPSLANVFHELETDMGCYFPNNGCLIPWAKQGVLLLNSILTVRRNESGSHKYIRWDMLTDLVISWLNQKEQSIVFMLWGAQARSKECLIDDSKHLILKAPHPSPLAGGAFFGCKHFSKCNEFLYEIYPTTIDWQIPNI